VLFRIPEWPAFAFSQALDVAPDAEAEDVARLLGVAQLRERNTELGRPAKGVDPGGDVPDAVPRVVLIAVVAHRVVALHAVRIDRELVAGAPVVVGVDQELDLIRRAADVATRERVHDAVRM